MAAKKDMARKSLCISINLLPPEYRKTQKDLSWITDRRIIWPTIALLAAIVGVYWLNSFTVDTISGLNSELERVRAEVERERPLLTKISDLEQKRSVINTKINALKSIQVSKKRSSCSRMSPLSCRRTCGLPAFRSSVKTNSR